jgi:hypothetical protein
MKTTSQMKIQLVARLNEVIEMRRALDKEEAAIKSEIKAMMKDMNVLEAGPLMVVLSERTRKTLDVQMLAHDFGAEFFNKYERPTTYQVLEVKPVVRK